MDRTLEKFKKKVYAEKLNANEIQEKYNKSANRIAAIPVFCFFLAIAIVSLDVRWQFGIWFLAIIPAVIFVVTLCVLIKLFSKAKQEIKAYRAKIVSIQAQYQKTEAEEDYNRTYSEIREFQEFKNDVKVFFEDAKDTDSFVRLSNKTIVGSLCSIVLCFALFFGVSGCFVYTPKRWKAEPEKRSYMVKDIKGKMNATFTSGKYNLYSLKDEEIGELFYVEGQEIPEIDFEFRSSQQTYNAYYMYTKNNINYWVLCIHLDRYRTIEFIETDGKYSNWLSQNADEPDKAEEEYPTLMPKNYK